MLAAAAKRELACADDDSDLAALECELAQCKGKRWLTHRAQLLETAIADAKQRSAGKRRKRSPPKADSKGDLREAVDEPSESVPVMDLDGEDYCLACNQPMRIVPAKALLVCTRCGCCSTYIDSTTSSMAYGEEIEISSMYCYKRLNHFRLQLAQLQATESCEISQDIIDQVMEELYKDGIRNSSMVTVRMIRLILKRLKLRKCYDHIPQIHSRVTGIPPVRLTPELLEKIQLMFVSTQEAFEKHCPPDRKNFISYRFLLYKMFQLLGYDELLPFMTLLKGKDKLLKQDAIFRSICHTLNWEFISSL